MPRRTILFLAANPPGTDLLALDREAQAIQAELDRAGYRDRFELATRWATSPMDLLRTLVELRPLVVHFSGHGGEDGLYLQANGEPQLVSAEALADTFAAAGASVKVVVLNACYSELQAEALRAHVDCVVGMSNAISDRAARAFATGFYLGVGAGESIVAAYRQGCAAIGLEGLAHSARPQLKLRDGIDASRLVLADTHERVGPGPDRPGAGPRWRQPRYLVAMAVVVALAGGAVRLVACPSRGATLTEGRYACVVDDEPQRGCELYSDPHGLRLRIQPPVAGGARNELDGRLTRAGKSCYAAELEQTYDLGAGPVRAPAGTVTLCARAGGSTWTGTWTSPTAGDLRVDLRASSP